MIQLRDLAARESLSVRTFTRRFRAETGVSPGQWLTRQRLERARRLLESTDLSVDRVAGDAGFGTVRSLRQHFQAALGVTPSAYRRRFRDGDEGTRRPEKLSTACGGTGRHPAGLPGPTPPEP